MALGNAPLMSRNSTDGLRLIGPGWTWPCKSLTENGSEIDPVADILEDKQCFI